MSDAAKAALEALLALTPAERAEIAEIVERLLARLDDEPQDDQAAIGAFWEAEAERRIDVFLEGKIRSDSVEDVMKRLLTKYTNDLSGRT